MLYLLGLYTAISRKVVGINKASKCTRKTERWSGCYGILHIGLEEIYKFVFLHVENLVFLSGANICGCRMSLSEENSSWPKNVKNFNTCSSSIRLTILPFRIGLCSLCFFRQRFSK